MAATKIRTRKKDVKTKYEPTEFAEELIAEIASVAAQGPEAVSAHLTTLDDKLNYKSYGEVLFDVLFTGGMLGAGGEYSEKDMELSPFCVFKTDDNIDSIKKTVEVFNQLVRRFRYLQKSYEDNVSKMLRFINRFSPADVNKLAMACAVMFASQMCPLMLLNGIFSDHLVKEGISLQFVTTVFRTYLKDNSVEHLSANIKKNGLEDQLLDFFPPNKRTTEFFCRHFNAEGLEDLVKYHMRKLSVKAREEIRDSVVEMIQSTTPHSDIILYVKQQAQKSSLGDVEVVEVVFDALMKAIEWPRKPELCESVCMKHVREWSKVLAAFSNNAKCEMAVMRKLQVHCYEDARITKIFAKLVQILYQLDVVTENAVVYWHTKGAVNKGKALLVSQLQPFVNWLAEAEEEDEAEARARVDGA